MTNFETIRLERGDRGIARLVLARASKRNALDGRCIAEIRAALAEILDDNATRVLVLAAEGDCFSAGADLHWMHELAQSPHGDRLAAATQLAGLLRDINTLPKPVVARVQGAAFGGGVGLLSACDIVVASENARFALSEVRLGLIPATIAPYLTARLGGATARRLMLTGRAFGAAEALTMKLVDALVPAADLDAGVERELADLLRGAPGALAGCKALCRNIATQHPSDLPSFTAEQLAERLGREEARTGIADYLAGRRPPWAE